MKKRIPVKKKEWRESIKQADHTKGKCELSNYVVKNFRTE